MKENINREQWLKSAVEIMKPLFTRHGYSVPEVQVSCGWPSRRARAAKKRFIGECWPPNSNKEKLNHIFISPVLEKPSEVLETLVHEVVHAVVGCKHGHKKPFADCALKVGLTGKMTATFAGEELVKTMETWSKQLGNYPHGSVDLSRSPIKKQTTRLIKVTCSECGFTCRMTRKWLDEVGPALCPAHGEMEVEAA